jgi:hypothetical protein
LGAAVRKGGKRQVEEVLDLGLDLRLLHGLARLVESIIMARWKCATAAGYGLDAAMVRQGRSSAR